VGDLICQTFFLVRFFGFMLSRFSFFVGLGRNDKRLLFDGACGMDMVHVLVAMVPVLIMIRLASCHYQPLARIVREVRNSL